MSGNALPIIGPLLRSSAATRAERFDQAAFYNAGSVIVFGFGFAALSFRLLPPLSPAFRTRRLLALTLRDLRRLAIDRSQPDWQAHVRGRLAALPDEATPLQRAQLVAALSVGSEIIDLRQTARHLGLGSSLGAALAALAQGHSAAAIAQLSRLDDVLAAGGPGTTAVLRARGSILVLSEALERHAAYFDRGAHA
jgi:hypothetical protein